MYDVADFKIRDTSLKKIFSVSFMPDYIRQLEDVNKNLYIFQFVKFKFGVLVF